MSANCSVIIVSFQTGPILFATLKSLLHQQQLFEIILVDNGNPPDTVARLQQMSLTEPRLKIITGHGNVGLARGSNIGLKIAGGEFLFFIHPDCLVPPDALTACLVAFADAPEAVIAGCTLLNADGSVQLPQHAGLLTIRLYLRERLPFAPKPTHNADAGVYETDRVSSAFMAIRARDLRMLEGFDDDYYLHGLDMDLFMRVRKEHGKLICVSNLKVTHLHKSSVSLPRKDLEWFRAKGYMRYFRKHFKGKIFPGALTLVNIVLLARYLRIITVAERSKSDRSNGTLSWRRLMVLASGLAELPEDYSLYGKTVFVTGATSEIGLCVLRRLMAAGASVLALSRGNPIPFEHEHLRWIRDDLDNPDCNLQGYYADIAVHCAPLWTLPPAIPMLAQAGVGRIIAFGSATIFIKVKLRNGYENEVALRLQKAEREIAELCNTRQMPWTIFRPTLVYGVGLDNGISYLYRCICRWGRIFIYPPGLGHAHPTHADDLAIAVMQMLEAPASYSKIYNVSGGEILTWREILEKLFAACGKKTRIVSWRLLPFALDIAGWLMKRRDINAEAAYRMNEDMLFFHEAAKNDFGYKPRAFLAGGKRDLEGF